jgi:hypothetical protein
LSCRRRIIWRSDIWGCWKPRTKRSSIGLWPPSVVLRLGEGQPGCLPIAAGQTSPEPVGHSARADEALPLRKRREGTLVDLLIVPFERARQGLHVDEQGQAAEERLSPAYPAVPSRKGGGNARQVSPLPPNPPPVFLRKPACKLARLNKKNNFR